jgi:hypothetical protein
MKIQWANLISRCNKKLLPSTLCSLLVRNTWKMKNTRTDVYDTWVCLMAVFCLLFFFHLNTRFTILQHLHVLGNRYLQFFSQKHISLHYLFLSLNTWFFIFLLFCFLFLWFFFKIIFIDFIFNIEMIENLTLYVFSSYFVFQRGLWVCRDNSSCLNLWIWWGFF